MVGRTARMALHSRSNVSYHSSRSEVLPRMSHSSHFWPGMDNGSLHSTSDDGHSGELKLQRAAAHGHPTHRLFTAHLTYPPAARAAVAPVGRSRAKLLFLHILCKSLARSACCCCWLVAWDAQSQGPRRMPLPDSQYSMPIHSSLVILQILVLCTTPGKRRTCPFDEGMPTF